MSKKQKRMLRRICLGGLLFLLGLLGEQWGMPGSLALIGAWLISGYDVILGAGRNLMNRKPFDEEFLMTLASGCAIVLGDFKEAAAVMIFYQVGELFQSIAVERSRKSVASLMDLRPDTAYILRDGQPEEADPEEVQVGDLVQVGPGERIPVDGVIVSGSASIDTSKITGESVPAELGPGEKVLSGCIDLSGVLVIRAESEYASSTVARILELMDSASEGRSKTESLITRFARVYTPCVVLGAAVLAFLPPLFDGLQFAKWLHRALNFLVVSCPCALVISVPLAFFGGMGAVSKAGMIAKGGIALENLAKVDTIFFDKTGTLTTGQFQLVNVQTHWQREKLLRLVAAAEDASHHPIARAICGAAESYPAATEVREIPGQGIQAQVDGHFVQAGNQRMLESLHIPVPHVEGATMVYAVVDGTYAGTLVLADTVKPGAAQTLEQLRELGVKRICMLTGDREAAAADAARQLGQMEYRWGLLPQDKVSVVKKAIDDGGRVAFVGDGVNDAPVMSLAAVGVAMGGVGSDAAVEASDLVLLKDDVAMLPVATRLARKTIAIARQNIVFALLVKFGVMALSIPGYANMWMAVFADVGVAILCILNSFRAMYAK